jgi:two-component system OmpR family response regulator
VLVSQLRKDGQGVPIILLTVPDCRAEDRAAALNAGADECLTPPFATVELAARLNAVARRATTMVVEARLRAHDIEMDLLHRKVWRQGQPIKLQPSEFRLLEQLVRHGGRVVTKTMLLERVWAYDFDPATSVVQTQVSRLRAKLNRGFEQDAIRTVRGAGYMIGSPPS